VAAARAAGNNNIADMLARMHVVPGQGIDFGALGSVLLLALGLYVASSVFSWMQGFLLNDVVQSTVFKLRSDVEDKLSRLPLQFFDKQPRGELLSRVTNDIDNVSLSLQQTISQLLFGLLTVVGVIVMMFVVSPLLAVIALITVPVSILIARRSGSAHRRCSSRSGLTPAPSTATSRRPSPATSWSRCSGASARSRRFSERGTSSCSRRASGLSSSPG